MWPETGDLPELHHLPADRFGRRFVTALPADPDLRNVPRLAPGACYTPVMPTAVAAPRLLAWSDSLGVALGLARPVDQYGRSAAVLAGNQLIPGMMPYAARYGGHQFGHWAGQLGDGRAITLGELTALDGAIFELQLKGAGPTPYARHADGRAVLRSSLREFLCSEAMFHLGVPTTRALSLVGTGESVRRDMFYDGHPKDEPGAVVCRVAPSFVRFGSFQIHAACGEHDALRRLADHVISQHFTPLVALRDPAERIARWFDEICQRTALMVAHWMRVGFVHGVMNTDNMSILGLTIDYGPYGWLEGYEPGWTPNTTDAEGRRYCFGRQPQIAGWNLTRLAEALLPLQADATAFETSLDGYFSSFDSHYRRMLAEKLGWPAIDPATGNGASLLEALFALLQVTETDMTIFFRRLAQVPVDEESSDAALLTPLLPAFYVELGRWPSGHQIHLLRWLRDHGRHVRHGFSGQGDALAGRIELMNRSNPKYVLRNYLARQCIDALAAGDSASTERLFAVLQQPYDEQPAHEDLAGRRPEWARHLAGCSTLSCSS